MVMSKAKRQQLLVMFCLFVCLTQLLDCVVWYGVSYVSDVLFVCLTQLIDCVVWYGVSYVSDVLFVCLTQLIDCVVWYGVSYVSDVLFVCLTQLLDCVVWYGVSYVKYGLLWSSMESRYVISPKINYSAVDIHIFIFTNLSCKLGIEKEHNNIKNRNNNNIY